MTNLEDFLLHDDVTKTYFSTIQDIYCSDILSFVDDDGEEEESEFSRERYEQDPRDLKPEEYVRCDLITAGSPFVNSLWTSDVFTKRADISPYFLYYSQFENVCQQFNKGMRAYREYSSFLFTPVCHPLLYLFLLTIKLILANDFILYDL